MTEEQKSSAGWQRGLELFIGLSGWLVGPLLAALFIGRWLDERYHSKPWLFLLSTGIAFIITIIGIGRQAISYIKEIEAAAKNIKKVNNDHTHHDRTGDNH